jgi:hypothetical protein
MCPLWDVARNTGEQMKQVMTAGDPAGQAVVCWWVVLVGGGVRHAVVLIRPTGCGLHTGAG